MEAFPESDHGPVWLKALETAYQQRLLAQLRTPAHQRTGPADQPGTNRPYSQSVYCIDVRSEVFRRALESVSPALHTRGFAGFFGLFIAYSPVGSALTRPQLPGLLAAAHCVSERVESVGLGQVLAKRRKNALQWRQRWSEFRGAPSSAFSFVESMGLLYGAKLLSDSLASTQAPARW